MISITSALINATKKYNFLFTESSLYLYLYIEDDPNLLMFNNNTIILLHIFQYTKKVQILIF